MTKYNTNTLVRPTPAFEECCVDRERELNPPRTKFTNLLTYI